MPNTRDNLCSVYEVSNHTSYEIIYILTQSEHDLADSDIKSGNRKGIYGHQMLSGRLAEHTGRGC
jgi:hypothetical protein